MSVCVCMHACVYVFVRCLLVCTMWRHQGSYSITFYRIPCRQDLSLNLELSMFACIYYFTLTSRPQPWVCSLSGQQAPENLPCLTSQGCWTMRNMASPGFLGQAEVPAQILRLVQQCSFHGNTSTAFVVVSLQYLSECLIVWIKYYKSEKGKWVSLSATTVLF